MKILFDEGVPKIILSRLRNLSIANVRKWLERHYERELLSLMSGQFQVLITTDKNLPFQQNLKPRQISAVIIPTNDVPSVIEMLPQIESALATIAPGEFVLLT